MKHLLPNLPGFLHLLLQSSFVSIVTMNPKLKIFLFSSFQHLGRFHFRIALLYMFLLAFDLYTNHFHAFGMLMKLALQGCRALSCCFPTQLLDFSLHLWRLLMLIMKF